MWTYLNLKLQLRVDGVHHLSPFHRTSTFITLPYKLRTHTHTHINTAFTIPLYAGSEVTPAVASHLADRLKSFLARFVLRRVFRCFLTNSLVRKTTMCTGIRFGFMVTHCLWNVLQEASRTDTASLSLSRHLNSQVQRGRKPKPNFLRLLQWDTLILPQLRGHIRREERERERETWDMTPQAENSERNPDHL